MQGTLRHLSLAMLRARFNPERHACVRGFGGLTAPGRRPLLGRFRRVGWCELLGGRHRLPALDSRVLECLTSLLDIRLRVCLPIAVIRAQRRASALRHAKVLTHVVVVRWVSRASGRHSLPLPCAVRDPVTLQGRTSILDLSLFKILELLGNPLLLRWAKAFPRVHGLSRL